MPDVSFDNVADRFDQDKYSPCLTTDSQFDENLAEMEKRVNYLPERRIQWLNDEGQGVFSKWSVDTALVIRAPAEAFRKHQASLWNQIARDDGAAGSMRCLYGIVVTAVGAGAAFLVAPEVAAVVGVVGVVATLFFASLKWSSASVASEQASAWSNSSPALELANQRTEAYRRGFPYIYSHHLKFTKEGSSRGVLLPLEVSAFYDRYFPEFCKNLRLRDPHDNPGRARWIESFQDLNPLAAHIMEYGLNQVPDVLKVVAEDYARFNSAQQSLESYFADVRRQVNDNINQRIAALEAQRSVALDPWIKQRTTTITNAKEERDAIFKDHPLETCKIHQKAEETFNAKKKFYEDSFKALVAPIHAHFDLVVGMAETERKASLSAIHHHRTLQVASYYDAARELLLRAERAWKGEAPYQPVNLNFYFNLQVPQPVAPPAPVFNIQVQPYYAGVR